MTEEHRADTALTRLAWVLRSRELLDQSSESLDAATLSRLNRSRQRALAGLDPPRRLAFLHWVGTAAVSGGIALMIWQGSMDRPLPDLPAPAATTLPAPSVAAVAGAMDSPVIAPDFELLLDAGDYALIEDMEFYAWLASGEGEDG